MFLIENEISQLAECRWPAVGGFFADALREAVELVLTHFDVLGIIAAGSILRGNAGQTSDWDLFVIHAHPQRQRIQKLLHQVPVEIFINPPHTVRDYFVAEHQKGQPSTAHMLATGFVVLDRDPVVEQLRLEAQAWLDKTPPLPTADEQTWQRYAIADTLDNAWDILDTDPANAARLMHRAVDGMIEFAFRSEQHFLPRPKQLIEELDEIDPILETLLRQYYATADVHFQSSLAQRIAERTIGVSGFFEWESPLQQMPEETAPSKLFSTN